MKKTLAIVLSVLMAFSVFAVAASAETPEGYYEIHVSPIGLEEGEYYAILFFAEFITSMRESNPEYTYDFYYNPTTEKVAFTVTYKGLTGELTQIDDLYALYVRELHDEAHEVKVTDIQHGDYYMTAESFSLAQWGDTSEAHMTIAEQRVFHDMTEVTIYLPSEKISYKAYGETTLVTPDRGFFYDSIRNAILVAHTFGEWTYDDSTHTRACIEEGCSYSETADHVWVEGETDEATCTENGAVHYNCVCGAEKSEPIPAGHDFDDTIEENVTVVAATCTEAGSKTVKCSRCDETDVTELEALGHAWGEWEVTKEATDSEAGEKTRHCTREGCDATETEEIPVVKLNFFQKIAKFFRDFFAKIKAFFQSLGKK